MIRREVYLKIVNELLDTDFIKVFTGIRRSGKTTLLHSIINELKNNGIKESNIIYMSFESSKYQGMSTFNELNELVHELTKDISGKIYLFFDEIQNIKEWEKSINGFRVDLNCDIYITGSNSSLLSGEYATLLTGRYIEIKVYPFSFKEIIQYKKEKENILLTNENKKNLFYEYIKFGGMPGILEIKDENIKKTALIDIYSSIIYNDIVGRHNIKKIDMFKRFSLYILNTMGETFSSKSITNYLKTNVEQTTRTTILNFTNYLEDAMLISKTKREDLIGKRILQTKQKYYLMDHGFHEALIENNMTKISHVIENIVYIELLRRGYHVKIGSIKRRKGKNLEIDFVCTKYDEKKYIQVSYILSSEKTIEREFKPLLMVNDNFDKYVISMDEVNMSRDGIKHLNIIDFLLDENSI